MKLFQFLKSFGLTRIIEISALVFNVKKSVTYSSCVTYRTCLFRPMETSPIVIFWMIQDVQVQHQTQTERREAGDMFETGEGWTLIM